MKSVRGREYFLVESWCELALPDLSKFSRVFGFGNQFLSAGWSTKKNTSALASWDSLSSVLGLKIVSCVPRLNQFLRLASPQRARTFGFRPDLVRTSWNRENLAVNGVWPVPVAFCAKANAGNFRTD